MTTATTLTYMTPLCIRCGQRSYVELDRDRLRCWQAGAHIQTVWPDKTPDERELLITGTHPECWDAMFPEEEEEE